jgi:hypothetical protein
MSFLSRLSARTDTQPILHYTFYFAFTCPLLIFVYSHLSGLISRGSSSPTFSFIPTFMLLLSRTQHFFSVLGAISLLSVFYLFHVRLDSLNKGKNVGAIRAIDFTGLIWLITFAALLHLDIYRDTFITMVVYFMFCFSTSAFYLILDGLPRFPSAVVRIAEWTSWALHLAHFFGFVGFVYCLSKRPNRTGVVAAVSALLQHIAFVLVFAKLAVARAIFLRAPEGPRAFATGPAGLETV